MESNQEPHLLYSYSDCTSDITYMASIPEQSYSTYSKTSNNASNTKEWKSFSKSNKIQGYMESNYESNLYNEHANYISNVSYVCSKAADTPRSYSLSNVFSNKIHFFTFCGSNTNW